MSLLLQDTRFVFNMSSNETDVNQKIESSSFARLKSKKLKTERIFPSVFSFLLSALIAQDMNPVRGMGRDMRPIPSIHILGDQKERKSCREVCEQRKLSSKSGFTFTDPQNDIDNTEGVHYVDLTVSIAIRPLKTFLI